MYEYEFTFSVNLARVLTTVAEVLDHVNESMASFGFPEKLVIRSNVLSAKLSNVGKLTVEARDRIGSMMLEELCRKFPDFQFEYESCKETHDISHT